MTKDELINVINELPLERRLEIIDWLSNNIRQETEREAATLSRQGEVEQAENNQA